jgi:hypothetical protein
VDGNEWMHNRHNRLKQAELPHCGSSQVASGTDQCTQGGIARGRIGVAQIAVVDDSFADRGSEQTLDAVASGSGMRARGSVGVGDLRAVTALAADLGEVGERSTSHLEGYQGCPSWGSWGRPC